jgi:putative flippase GtrA
MTGSGPVAAFLRFVLFGGGVTLLGSGALLLVGDRVPLALANAAVTVATTVLATELHGRFTFRRGRAGWSDHCASGLTVLLSYLFTTGALLAFDAWHPGSGALLRQGVYLTASGAAGFARFLLLRYVVFAQPSPSPGPSQQAQPSQPVQVPQQLRPSAAPQPSRAPQPPLTARIGRTGGKPALWASAAASPREPAPSLPRMLAT